MPSRKVSTKTMPNNKGFSWILASKMEPKTSILSVPGDIFPTRGPHCRQTASPTSFSMVWGACFNGFRLHFYCLHILLSNFVGGGGDRPWASSIN